jgi:Fe2+ transport system protein FeoA
MSNIQKSLLSVVPSSASLQLVGFDGEAKIVERLKELGLYQGLRFQLQSRLPFRGPQLIRFGATVLALRTEEAACLQIK